MSTDDSNAITEAICDLVICMSPAEKSLNLDLIRACKQRPDASEIPSASKRLPLSTNFVDKVVEN